MYTLGILTNQIHNLGMVVDIAIAEVNYVIQLFILKIL